MASRLLFAAIVAATASAEQVLLLGKSPSPLWHDTRSSSALSVAGMTDLALNSLGLRTGRIASTPAVQSPVQADIFTHSDIYAIIIVENVSPDTFSSLKTAADTFHALYPAESANFDVMTTVVDDFNAKYASATHCAGSAALCATIDAQTPTVSPQKVQQVLAASSFLDVDNEQDVVFAQELAHVQQLSKDLQQFKGKTLFVVGLSGLEGKKTLAQEAVTSTLKDFLVQLMQLNQVVGAQIMTGNIPAAIQETAELWRNRKLTSDFSDEEDEEDEETEDLAADASSSQLDDNNATNITVADAVSMPEIAEFQIILWTSVILGAMLLSAVMAMATMDTGRDSLLYAKFIADVNGRKTN